MTLGERIYQYRTERGLSQLEVAEQLDVSRQSVSKWETDGAVPDLDKLVKLSGLFGVTMDELVKGERPAAPEGEAAPASEAPAPESAAPPPAQVPTRDMARIVAGGVLLAVGLLAMLVLFIFRYEAALLALPVVAVGVILLAVRRGAGLICGWLALAMVMGSFYLTGMGLGVIVDAPLWLLSIVVDLFRGRMDSVFELIGQEYILGLLVIAAFVVLVVVTARRIYRTVKK